MKAVVYTRVSTENQGGDDHVSLDMQQATCRRYAEGQGWEVVGVYQDMQSGTDPAREDYQRLLTDAQARRFDVVIAYNSSRWGRDAVEALRSVGELERTGVRVHSTTGDMGSFLVHGINAIMDEEHSRRLSRTIRPNLQRIAERGDWPGSKLCVGYKREGKRVVIDPVTGPLVRRIFEMAAGGATFAACQRALIEWGYPITDTGIKRVLTNPFYTGKLRWLDPSMHLEFKAARDARRKGKRERHLYDGNHEAIVDDALWQQTQDAIGRRMHKLRRANTGLSGGLVRCGHCGLAANWYRVSWKCRRNGEYTGEVRYYPYYRCSPEHQQTPQCRWTLRAEAVDDWLRDQLRSVTVREDSIDRMAALLDAERNDLLAKHDAGRRAVEHSLSALHDRDNRLMDAMLDGTITKAQYAKRHGEFQRSIQQAEVELTAFRPAQLPDYAAFIADLRQLPEALARGDRQLRPLLRNMGLGIEIRSKTDIRLVGLMEGLL